MTQPLFNGYIIDEKQLYIIEKDWPTELKLKPNAYYLLKKNPKINLERLVKKQNPKMFIIDGSNTAFYIERWEKTLKETNTAYYITTRMGTYEFNRENEE